ncbi:winged-helix domain-containing protein [Spirillospora sp. NPDC048911]|uniref:winged helix-turn-helix transcriptional regulator n=1 Tax=Spirillospora sp. NPDC048911 TaxID=3364527 RepID=UPI0037205598
MRVLVVEDQADLVEILLEGLRGAGMAVDSALGGVDALELLAVNEYDVVVLDRDLPDVHGDEFGVLEVLLGADGAVVSSEQLLERVWDEHTDPFTNTVRVTMMRLRRKLGEPGVVATLPGVGYRIAR